jgi:tetratricopeptide (TPR) repeat protein
MFRITSLTEISDRQLDRLVKRIAAILLIGLIAFVGFYVLDRWRAPAAPIVDQRTAALEQAVRDDPADIPSRGQLADIYVATGRYVEAIAQYDAILDAGKDVELAHMGRGKAYQASGQLDAATRDFQEVVDIAKGGEMANVDPMLEAAYYSLGSIAMDQGKPAEAIGHLEKALAIKRSDADALNLISKAHLAVGDTDKAILTAKAAIAFVPIGWTDPYLTLSQTYTKAGQPEMAEWAAAMADFSDGKTDQARTRLTVLSGGGPAAVDAMIGLGLIAESAGELPLAATWYEQALAVDPNNAAARLGVGRAGSGNAPATEAGPTPLPSLPNPGNVGGGQGS